MNAASLLSAVADHLWQSTALAAAIWLLTLALRNNSARLRHRLWLIASAKFLLPFSLLIALGARFKPPSATVQPRREVSLVLLQITQPFSATVKTTPTITAPSATTSHSSPSPFHANPVPFALASIWALGFLAVVFNWFEKWRKIQRAIDDAVPVDRLDNIPVLSSKSLLEPGVFGIIKPKLLLPEGIRGRLTDSQLRAIFTHELVHVDRRDNLSAAVHMLVQAIFWFHPLLWWIGARLVEERELACDEAVVQAGNEPEDYAQGILNVCKSYLEPPLVCVSGITGADLKRRVVRIITNRVSRRLDFGRKLLLAAAALFAVAAPVTFGLLHVTQARAQNVSENSPTNLAGIWQGTLSFNGNSVRLVLKIDKAADGWTGKLYSIDQAPQPFPASPSLQGGEVKLEVRRIGGNFDGKMSADGSTITGTWSQGPNPLPLVLKRVAPDAAWPIPDAPAPPKPMSADAKAEFEVATIKPSNASAPGKGFMIRGRRFNTLNTSLDDLFTFSYHISAHQVIAMPDWANSQKYDIEAQPDGEGQPSNEQWMKMLQKLLADRFKLAFHNEQKDMSVYALSVAKSGPKMTPNNDDPNGLPMLQFRGLGDLVAANADMEHFAGLLQEAVLDRPVVDHTGLSGKYDFQLKWTPDPTQFAGLGMKPPAPSNAPDAPPDLYAAVQQQLGLKIDTTRAPVKVYVIDHVEQPSAN